jgi:hypothetical protein
MGGVKEAVADRVGDARVVKVLVSLGRQKLAGDDGGAGAAAIVDNFEQIISLGVAERGETEVVDDEHVEAS